MFCGTKSFSKVAESRGHETFTIDIDAQHEPDLVADLRTLTINDLPEEWRHPGIVWASPDCSCFSVASMGKHWTGGNKAYIPKTEKAKTAIEICINTHKLICDLAPKYWIIENPRGVLFKLGIFPTENWQTAWYCQYGDSRAKPTTLCTNVPIKFRTCMNGNSDHTPAKRGAKTGTQGIKGKVARSIVPKMLCEEIIIACESGTFQAQNG